MRFVVDVIMAVPGTPLDSGQDRADAEPPASPVGSSDTSRLAAASLATCSMNIGYVGVLTAMVAMVAR